MDRIEGLDIFTQGFLQKMKDEISELLTKMCNVSLKTYFPGSRRLERVQEGSRELPARHLNQIN